jgi:ribosome-associated toxin RatA of RatAB toxin-antitoxin module
MRTLLLSWLLLVSTFATTCASTLAAAQPSDKPSEKSAPTKISVRQEGNILTVEGTLFTSASRAGVWKILTDFSRFPEFIPGLYSNRLLEQRDNLKLIEQRGMISTRQIQMPFQGVIQVEEQFRDGVPEGMQIVYLNGPLKDVRGEWNIQPGKLLGLTYRMRMDITKTPFPPLMATPIAEQQVQNWVDAFSREMQKAH